MVEATVEYGPSYPILKVKLQAGESVVAEPGALMLYKGDVKVETKTLGIVKGILRSLFGGESAFLNIYTCESGSAEIWFAPSFPGDICEIQLNGEEWLVQPTSYLAHTGDISVSIGWKGLKGLLAESTLFYLKASGVGRLWITSFGKLVEVEVPEGEKIVVDNMHFVAMRSDVKWNIKLLGKFKTWLFGGEGIVFEIEGPAKVYLQTRMLEGLAKAVAVGAGEDVRRAGVAGVVGGILGGLLSALAKATERR